MRGSKFRKADLQVHTPASECYSDKSVTAQEIVKTAIASGLEILAITDHNTAAFVDAVRAAAKATPLHVFPGVEITAGNAHIVGILDLKTSVEDIHALLARVDILPAMRGKNQAVGADPEKVIKEIHAFGGIAIAAHANSTNGLLKNPKGEYRIKLCKLQELLALEFTKAEDCQKFCKGSVPGYPAKACLQSSDAHGLAEIGQRFTYLKMDLVELPGIRQALLDHEVKVRFMGESVLTSTPQILSLQTSAGFFEGVTFEFHPQLNCLVGGKGTGKSTIIELMRYAFNQLPAFDEIRDDTIGKAHQLVGIGGTIRLRCRNPLGEEFVITRVVTEADDASSVCQNAEGDDSPLPFVPVFFSQGELARVAASQLAQMNLIDKYVDIQEENLQEDEHLRRLETNATDLVHTEEAIASLTSQLGDPRTGKSTTESEIKVADAAVKEPILSEFPKWEAEARFIEGTMDVFRELADAAQDALTSIDVEDLFSADLADDSPSATLLRPFRELSTRIQSLLLESGKRLKSSITALEPELEKIHTQWRKSEKVKRSQYKAVLEKAAQKNVGALQERLSGLKQRLERLQRAQKDLEKARKRRDVLLEKRTTALKGLADCCQRRYDKRVAKTSEWEESFGGKIQLRVQHRAERAEYAERLKAALKGSHVQDKDQRLIIEKLEPSNLRNLVIAGDVAPFLALGLTAAAATKTIEYLRQHSEALLGLQSVHLRDLPEISLEVAEGVWKPLNQLSTGQKGTVVVLLAMVEGDASLLIDQPEDSLDTTFIYDHIVKKLREQKDSRQFIFATHNANLLVSTDADLSFVLEATAEKGEIRSHGGIDRKDTNDLLLIHLEGGDQAFRVRGLKYGR